MIEQTLREIVGFAVVTVDLDRLVRFYCKVLGFSTCGEERPIQPTELTLFGLGSAGRRRVLSLGRQTLWIDQFEQAGRIYPAAYDSASLGFQHLALVVCDIAEAYARLRKITPISQGGPQKLPTTSGGAQAFKFRDPDGHPLELLQFSPRKTPDAWRGIRPLEGQIGLGIDHSAISVAEPEASTAFYSARGLRLGTRTLNRGRAQQRLDDLDEAEVAVIAMMPAVQTPHLELLGYLMSRGQHGSTLRANDVAATRIVWRGGAAALLHDPDGHLLQIEARE